MALTHFTVTGNFLSVAGQELWDAQGSPVPHPVSGTLTFTPLFNVGEATKTASAVLVLQPVLAVIKDGVLSRNGAAGCKLVANTSDLNLTELFYRVTFFGLRAVSGEEILLNAFDFLAPESAGAVDIATVIPVPGVPAIGRPGSNTVLLSSAGIISALGYTPQSTAAKGAVNGYAALDSSGLVPASSLPSYVDDVIEHTNLGAFPGTGVTGKIYVALDSNKVYRWSGSTYIEISPSPGSTDGVTEGSTNLYYTNTRADARVAAATTAASSKATPVDADVLPLADSAASFGLKKLTWNNLKVALAAYYDSLTSTLSNKTIAAPTLTGTTQVATGGSVELYNVGSSGATNFEKLRLDWSGNISRLINSSGGTGASRALQIAAGGQVVLASNYPFVSFTPPNYYTGGSTGVCTGSSAVYGATSGNQTVFGVFGNVNQSSTAGYTALLINPTETATGSGTKRLIDAQVGGVSKFTVDNAGNVVATTVNTYALGLYQQLKLNTTTGAGIVQVDIATGSAIGQWLKISGTQGSASAGMQTGILIANTIAQSGDASYTCLLINPTETSTGSGTKRLIDAQVGGTSRFTVDNAGTVSISGTAATIRAGAGSPQGAVTAAIGSMYTRTDGGAGTTLYIKESGTGNTGWVAK